MFRLKKNTEEEKKSEQAAVAPRTQKSPAPAKAPKKKASGMEYWRDLESVLLNPRVTEKATIESESGVYVFDIATRATKRDVLDAVEKIYKVVPRKVRVAAIPHKKVRSRSSNRTGVKAGGKKAYVYLKKGDAIEIV